MSLYGGGAERYYNNRRNGVVDRAIALPGPAAWVDKTAAEAEDWVRLKLGLPRQENIEQTVRPTKYEILLPNGQRLDVKWRPEVGGHLIERFHHNAKGEVVWPDKADLFCFVCGKSADLFTFRGWATAYELRTHIVDLGYGPTWGVHERSLHPFWSLEQIAWER